MPPSENSASFRQLCFLTACLTQKDIGSMLCLHVIVYVNKTWACFWCLFLLINNFILCCTAKKFWWLMKFLTLYLNILLNNFSHVHRISQHLFYSADSHLGPKTLRHQDISALLPKYPDPPNQRRSVLNPNCLGSEVPGSSFIYLLPHLNV